jgi:hypothetical protein
MVKRRLCALATKVHRVFCAPQQGFQPLHLSPSASRNPGSTQQNSGRRVTQVLIGSPVIHDRFLRCRAGCSSRAKAARVGGEPTWHEIPECLP